MPTVLGLVAHRHQHYHKSAVPLMFYEFRPIVPMSRNRDLFPDYVHRNIDRHGENEKIDQQLFQKMLVQLRHHLWPTQLNHRPKDQCRLDEHILLLIFHQSWN